jgi:hypothetical protein
MYSLEIKGATPEELYVNCLAMLADFVKRSAPPEPPVRSMMDVIAETGGNRSTSKKSAELDDDISDVGGPKKLTMDKDIRPRLRAIQEAHEKRGHDMKECVAYLLKLYEPFGIKNAKLLKPEQFEDFMKASEAFLDGSAK